MSQIEYHIGNVVRRTGDTMTGSLSVPYLNTTGDLAVGGNIHVTGSSTITVSETITGNLLVNGSITSSGGAARLDVTNGTAGASTVIQVNNPNNSNGASHAYNRILTGGANGGDPSTVYSNGVVSWSVGIDNSDSDKFKISSEDALGNLDKLTIDSVGNVNMGPGSLTVSGANGQFAVHNSTNANLIYASGGRVGVGTSTLDHVVTIQGAIGLNRIDSDLTSSNDQKGTIFVRTNGNSAANAEELRYLARNHSWSTNTGSRLVSLDEQGRIGVGIGSPTAQLHISGISNSQAFRVDASGASNALVVSSGGNIGVGESAPKSTLHIRHPNQTNSTYENKGLLITESADSSSGLALYSRDATECYIGLNTDFSDTSSYLILGTNLESASNKIDGIVLRQNGRVGINTSEPSAKLHVSGINSAQSLRVDASGLANALTVISGGNVGIKTASPGTLLEMGDTTASHSLSITSGRNSQSNIFFKDNDDADVGRIEYNHAVDTLAFFTSGAQHVTITSGGKVGIGTTAPENKLHIEKDTVSGSDEDNYGLKIEDGTNDVGLLLGADSTNNAGLIQVVDPDNSWTTRPLALQAAGGNVGIGTTSPTTIFHISGATNDIGVRMSNSTAAQTYQSYVDTGKNYLIYDVTNDKNRLIISGNGTVGINVVPSAQLTISGTTAGNALIVHGTGQANILFVSGNGNVGIGTTGPSSKLDVAGGMVIDNNAFYRARTTGGTNTILIGISSDDHTYLLSDAGNDIIIRPENAVTAITAKATTGNVGIGTITPTSKLHISGNIASSFRVDTSGASASLQVISGGITQFNNTVTFNSEYNNGNASGAFNINWNNGNKQKITLVSGTNLSFSGLNGPTNVMLKVVQDATGSRVTTWPAIVKWPAGSAPVLTQTGLAIDLISFYNDGTNYFGVATQAFA